MRNVMSFRVNNSNKQLLKNYNKTREKIEELIKILKANLFMVMMMNTQKKKKINAGSMVANFHNKECQKKKHHVNIYQ